MECNTRLHDSNGMRKLWQPFLYSAPPNLSRVDVHAWNSLDVVITIHYRNGARPPQPQTT